MDNTFTHRHAVEMWKHFPIDQSGYESDENPFSNKAIVWQLLESRSSIIKQSLRAGEEMSEFMVQTLPCVEVVEVDRNECPCTPASGCYWLKTKHKLPVYCKMISVTGIVANGQMPRFEFIKWDRFEYIPKSRIPSMRTGKFWTIRDNDKDGPYLYLYGDRFLENIAVSAIWENPMEAAAYPHCGEVNLEAFCNPLDVNFHTDAWMRDPIMQLTWQKLLPIRRSAQIDALNDDIVGNNPLNTQ